MKELTERQQSILAFIQKFQRAQSMPPTYREIGEAFGIRSTNGVRSILSSIEKKGRIRLMPKVSRGIQVVETADPAMVDSKGEEGAIPILGTIAAGQPVLALEQNDRTLSLQEMFNPRNSDVFALKVKGDSMIEAAIYDRDIAIIRKSTREPRNGEIVAVIIDDDATLKYFHKTGHQIRFEPANPDFKSIIIENPGENLSIIGHLIGIVRKY